MNLICDFFSLLAGCVEMLAALDRRGLYFAAGIGLVLAIICWVTCSFYSKLWNKRYQVHFVHHSLCALAALLTLAFAVVFAALKYTKEAAYASVMLWEVQINSDVPWANATFTKAYDAVKHLGVEDFTNVPAPNTPGSHIPTNHNVSILAAVFTYATQAAKHFNAARPFLSLILHSQTDVPTQVLDADVKNYFATVSKNYPPQRAISLVTVEIKKSLDAQLPRVVIVSRRIAIAGFVLVQLIPFGLVGLAAYKDIKVKI